MTDIKPELIEKAAQALLRHNIIESAQRKAGGRKPTQDDITLESKWWGDDMDFWRGQSRDALSAVADDLRAEGAAQALREAADDFDREAAVEAARHLLAGVRCSRCNLRYEERQEYSCLAEGTAHEYDEDELAHAAALEVRPTYDGDQLRAAADRIEARDE